MVWTRNDAQHGYTSPPRSGDWDQEMQCYQCVVQTATGEQFMFYSGNGYGEGGIGFAVRR